MGHRFIFPLQFGIENRTGVSLQCADQRKDNFPCRICFAVFNVHDRSNLYVCSFCNLALCKAKPEPSLPYDTA